MGTGGAALGLWCNGVCCCDVCECMACRGSRRGGGNGCGGGREVGGVGRGGAHPLTVDFGVGR